MTKIMLVEDDNNLREIYEARLAAEGFGIVSAQDGEAALALAAKERPDLIITDVMMPKISGFEMLDILRNTEGLRDVKVIMLTALGQAEDNARAGALGADRYLVKSQVTLEDIVKSAHDVLEGPGSVAADAVSSEAATQPTETPTTAPAEVPAALPLEEPAIAPAEVPAEQPTAAPVEQPTSAPTEQPAETQADQPAAGPTETAPAPTEPPVTAEVTSPEPTTTEAQETPAETAVETSATDDSSTDQPQTAAAEPEVIDDSTPAPDDSSTAQPEPAAAADDTPAEQTPSEPPQQNDSGTDTDTSTDDSQRDDSTDSTQPDVSTEQDQLAAPRPQESEQAAQAEEAAESSSQEESVMRAQIDEYIGTDSTPESVEPEISLPDEPEAEYEKDEQTPDMGELSIRAEQPIAPPPAVEAAENASPPVTPAPAPDSPSQPVSPAPGYPSQPYALPANPEAAITPTAPQPAPSDVSQPPAPVAAPAQPAETAVTNAINDMLAQTPGIQSPAPAAASAPESGAPGAPVSAQAVEPHQSGSVHSRIIAPLGTPSRPDINQLLSMEEAKNAAAQAGAGQNPQQPPLPPQQTGAASQPPLDDPNSIAL